MFLFMLGRVKHKSVEDSLILQVQSLLRRFCVCEIYLNNQSDVGFYVAHGEGTVLGSRYRIKKGFKITSGLHNWPQAERERRSRKYDRKRCGDVRQFFSYRGAARGRSSRHRRARFGHRGSGRASNRAGGRKDENLGKEILQASLNFLFHRLHG